MRRILPGCTIALLLGAGPLTANAAEKVAPSSIPLTQGVVTLAPGVDQVLGRAKNRRYLCVMNIGTGLVTLGFDEEAVAGAGWALDPAAADGRQGGAMCWEASVVAGDEIHAISAAGTTLAVLEGR